MEVIKSDVNRSRETYPAPQMAAKLSDANRPPPVEALIKIRQKLVDMDDLPPTLEQLLNDVTPPNERKVEPRTASNECVCCLLAIENGDIALAMPCCGQWVHAMCIAKVANSHHSKMNHACPHCVEKFSAKFEKVVLDMWQVLRKITPQKH